MWRQSLYGFRFWGFVYQDVAEFLQAISFRKCYASSMNVHAQLFETGPKCFLVTGRLITRQSKFVNDEFIPSGD